MNAFKTKKMSRHGEMKRILLISVICVAWWSVAFCFLQKAEGKTVYYVDYLNGSDSNNGKSPGSSFKHCPGDENARAIARTINLSAGDTICFKGGVAYKGAIGIKWSGTSERQPVVYDGNSAGTYGTGRAIIDGELARLQGFICQTKGIRFVKINNFEIRNMGPNVGASGISFVSSAEYITIENCYIHHIGTWSNEGKIPIRGSGIWFFEPFRCKISQCELTATGHTGIGLMGAVDCVIENNNIHHYVNWGIDISSYGNGKCSTGNIIRGNIVHDLYQFDKGFWGGDEGTWPHQDFIFIRGAGGNRPYNNIIDGNILYNNYSFKDAGGTAMLYIAESDRNVITNNILINPHSYFAISVSWGSTGTEIYNNLVWSPRASGIRINSTNSPDGITIKNNVIKNNVIISENSIIWEVVGDEKSWEIDYNYYFSPASKSFKRVQPYSAFSFREWQQGFGNDRRGRMLTSLEDFKFVNIKGYPTECQKMDFRPRPSSPLIDNGTKLQGFSHDFLGVKRPQGNGWDMGPHEYR
jgi:hypothetical protein